MSSLFNTYRPKNFDEVVGQKETVKLLRQQSITGKYRNTYVFAGHFGSGKTSLARIFAMALNCHCKDDRGNPCGECDSCRSIMEGNNADVIEYAASEQTGVEGADRLIESAKYAPVGDYKVYIIDEVQALSAQAFQRLLKITEEPPRYAVFIFCTTEYESIPAANRSRIQKYVFSQFANSEIAERVRFVAEDAGIKISDDVPETIAKYSDGSMRNAIVTLETVGESVAPGETATGETVESVLGVVRNEKIFDIFRAIGDNDLQALVSSMKELMTGGFNLTLLLNEMISVVKDLYLYRACDVCEGTNTYKEQIQQTVMPLPTLQKLTGVLLELRSKRLTENVIFLALISILEVKEQKVLPTPTDAEPTPSVTLDVPDNSVVTPNPNAKMTSEKAEPKKSAPKEEKAEGKGGKKGAKKAEPKPAPEDEDIFDVFSFGEEEEPKKVSEERKGEVKTEEKPVETNPFETPAAEENPFTENNETAAENPELSSKEEEVLKVVAGGDSKKASPKKESKGEGESDPFGFQKAIDIDAAPIEQVAEILADKPEKKAPQNVFHGLEPLYPSDEYEVLIREAYFNNNFEGIDPSDVGDDDAFGVRAEELVRKEVARLNDLAEKITTGKNYDPVEAVLVLQSERTARFYYEATHEDNCPCDNLVLNDLERVRRAAESDKILKEVLLGLSKVPSTDGFTLVVGPSALIKILRTMVY